MKRLLLSIFGLTTLTTVAMAQYPHTWNSIQARAGFVDAVGCLATELDNTDLQSDPKWIAAPVCQTTGQQTYVCQVPCDGCSNTSGQYWHLTGTATYTYNAKKTIQYGTMVIYATAPGVGGTWWPYMYATWESDVLGTVNYLSFGDPNYSATCISDGYTGNWYTH